MSEPEVCPLPECTEPAIHSHPALFEGLFGPRQPDQQQLPEAHGLTPIGASPVLQTVPCKCRCGATWDGVAVVPLRRGEKVRERLCDGCSDRAVAEAEKRHKATYPLKPPTMTYKRAEPLRRADID